MAPSQSDVSSTIFVPNFRLFPRMEPADTLENWIAYVSRRSCTSSMLQVAGVMDGETLLADCEDHAMVI